MRHLLGYVLGAAAIAAVGGTWLANDAPGSQPEKRSPQQPAPAAPAITGPILFDTPEADAILAALEVFPPDNPWNQVVSELAGASQLEEHHRLDRRRQAVALQPRHGLHPRAAGPEEGGGEDRRCTPTSRTRARSRCPTTCRSRAGRPTIEGKNATLDDVQRDKLHEGGDRHAIVVDPVNRMLYEFYQARKTDGGWQAAQASIFDLKSNKLRPGRLDLDRRRRAADLPGGGPLRRTQARRGRARHARDGAARRAGPTSTRPRTSPAS